jgi:hypothetical protein
LFFGVVLGLVRGVVRVETYSSRSAYEPSVHSMQAMAAGKGAYFPALQGAQMEAFCPPTSVPYRPGWHDPKHEGKPTPVWEEYVPFSHSAHARASVRCPGRLPYLPRGQNVLALSVADEEFPGQKKPRGHRSVGPNISASPVNSSVMLLVPAPASQKKLGGQGEGAETLARQ